MDLDWAVVRDTLATLAGSGGLIATWIAGRGHKVARDRTDELERQIKDVREQSELGLKMLETLVQREANRIDFELRDHYNRLSNHGQAISNLQKYRA